MADVHNSAFRHRDCYQVQGFQPTQVTELLPIGRPVDGGGGSVGSDEPPRLPNGPLEVFRKLLFWPLLTPQIAITSSVEDCSNTATYGQLQNLYNRHWIFRIRNLVLFQDTTSFRVFVCILALLKWKFSLCERFSAQRKDCKHVWTSSGSLSRSTGALTNST